MHLPAHSVYAIAEFQNQWRILSASQNRREVLKRIVLSFLLLSSSFSGCELRYVCHAFRLKLVSMSAISPDSNGA